MTRRASLALVLVVGCGQPNGPEETAAPRTVPSVTEAVNQEPARAPGGDAGPAAAPERSYMKIEPVSDEFRKRAEKAARSWFARQMRTGEANVEVELLDEDDVPQAALFIASLARGRGRRGPDDSEMPVACGLYDGHKVIAETVAAQAFAARGWGYGPERTVPAEQVARVFGFLESRSGVIAFAVADQEDLDDLPAAVKKRVSLPAETTVDGKPAVVYYVKEQKEDGLWRSTAVFSGGGKVDVAREELAR